MAPIFSRAALRESPFLFRATVVSFVLTTVILFLSDTPCGDWLGGYTDHVHHSRATWTFLVKGIDAYRLPLAQSSADIGYRQSGLTWPEYPVAYPPGMFVVFLLPAILGRFYAGSEQTFGHLIILELVIIAHLALWAFAQVFKRTESQFWTGVLVGLWLYILRVTLFGFYDAAWLLLGALGIDQMMRKRPGAALLYFVGAVLLSYRGASLGVFGLVALAQLLRSDRPLVQKLVTTLVAGAGVGVSAWAFWMLIHHSPPNPTGDANSHLIPFNVYSWGLTIFGCAAALVLGFRVSLLLGVSLLVTTALCILHAGHHWHGCLCVPVLFGFALVKKPTLWAQLLLAFWFTLFLRFAFLYDPMNPIDNLFHFAAARWHLRK